MIGDSVVGFDEVSILECEEVRNELGRGENSFMLPLPLALVI
jgi:hypothetical protein